MSRYRKIDRSKIRLKPLDERESKVTMDDLFDVTVWDYDTECEIDPETQGLADAVHEAKANGRAIIWFLAGHVVKHGLTPFIVDLMQNGYATHVACNGSVLIHEMELALRGHTSEDVGKYISTGEFGHWADVGMINSIVNMHYNAQNTIGEMVGQWLVSQEKGYAWSPTATGWRQKIPVTCHLLVGGDIIHQHPNCPRELFAASYNDFLVFGGSVEDLEGGVFINIGSQVTGTEVFLKALSMARNIAVQEGKPPIHNLTTGMLDFVKLPDNWRDGEASEGDAAYYYRPWKSILLRTVADGGRSFYLGGPHVNTLPRLWKAIRSDS